MVFEYFAFRAARESGKPTKMGSLPEDTLKQLAAWAKGDGWWKREWATVADAADALGVTPAEVESMVAAKELVGYEIDGRLLLPSRDLALAAWEKARAEADSQTD